MRRSENMSSHVKDHSPRHLAHLRQFFLPGKTLPSRSTRHGEDGSVNNIADESSLLGSLPPEVDISSMINPGTPPERLVDSVRRLEQFLPKSCKLFEPNDLKIVGSHPVDGGGFAEVWLCERDDGTMVTIKSYRCYSLLSRLPTYSVSTYPCSEPTLLKMAARDSTMKRSCVAT